MKTQDALANSSVLKEYPSGWKTPCEVGFFFLLLSLYNYFQEKDLEEKYGITELIFS